MQAMTEPSLSGWCRKHRTANRQRKSERKRPALPPPKNRLKELEVLLCKIYEDNILGKLPDSRYATLDAQYGKEQSELTEKKFLLWKQACLPLRKTRNQRRILSLIDKYQSFDNLTIAMLNEFIDKILVHERDRKGSQGHHAGN